MGGGQYMLTHANEDHRLNPASLAMPSPQLPTSERGRGDRGGGG